MPSVSQLTTYVVTYKHIIKVERSHVVAAHTFDDAKRIVADNLWREYPDHAEARAETILERSPIQWNVRRKDGDG